MIKTDRYNKLDCPHCKTQSCHICGMIVTGYDHFWREPTACTPNSCPLWFSDEVLQRLAM
jgi:hypothetical protein